jgi:hypothetical protein
MPHRTMPQIMDALGDDLLDDIDAIAREAHGTYRAYDPAILIEHDAGNLYLHPHGRRCRPPLPGSR